MRYEREERALASEFSDKARRVLRTGGRFLVPLKLDAKGQPLTAESFDIRKHLKSLSLTEIQFLSLWTSNEFDETKTIPKSLLTDEQCKRLFKKLEPFRQEHLRLSELAKVSAAKATPEYLIHRNLENAETGGQLNDSARDSLKEVAKLTGAYKQQAVTATVNVFNLPALPPEQEKKLKEVFDTIAIEGTAA